MSQLFVWGRAFLTGLPSVDAQHERLVEMLNDLSVRMLSPDGLEFTEFEWLRDQLLDYAKVHFTDEEAQMERVGVDARHVEQHRDAHQAFLDEVLSFAEVPEAQLVERLPRVLEFIMAWLTHHILGLDQSMARQIRAIGAGQTPAAAFKTEARHDNDSSEPLLGALTRLFQMVSARNRELRTLNADLERRVRERTAELESANMSLGLLNSRDDLTGGYNRRFALSKLHALAAEARRNGTPFSVLMVDADRFKSVNDRFGHCVGDQVLRTLASRLAAAVRTTDFVCRLGGDEFLIICPGTTREGTERIVTHILASRKAFPGPDGAECWDGSLSLGAVEFRDGMELPEDLLRAADQAMYAMKRQRAGDLPLPQDVS